ncbi:MAG: nucleoside triphosphate pyrophosphohydrolase [Steroidobacteraceae bacterium]
MSSPALEQLLQIMAQLRDPQGGCPWDREQTFATIAPHTLEEAYEVLDAIEQGDTAQLCDELGDLLFQVVFLARIAQEAGQFDFDAVAARIVDKLLRRHPHVFGAAAFIDSAQGQSQSWESLKAVERAAKGADSLLADVPMALPALSRAAKLGRRAARPGFDWSHASQAREKVNEELAELDAAIASGNALAIDEELGDLLHATTSWARHLGIDAEASLRAANRKFELRFRAMETLAVQRGIALESLSPSGWDGLWNEVKKLTPG